MNQVIPSFQTLPPKSFSRSCMH